MALSQQNVLNAIGENKKAELAIIANSESVCAELAAARDTSSDEYKHHFDICKPKSAQSRRVAMFSQIENDSAFVNALANTVPTMDKLNDIFSESKIGPKLLAMASAIRHKRPIEHSLTSADVWNMAEYLRVCKRNGWKEIESKRAGLRMVSYSTKDGAREPYHTDRQPHMTAKLLERMGLVEVLKKPARARFLTDKKAFEVLDMIAPDGDDAPHVEPKPKK